MKKCPDCGAQIEDDSLFCEQCGMTISNVWKCPHCGEQLNENDAFCQKCGNRLDGINSSTDSQIVQNLCPHCGKPVGAGDAFCENCGRDLKDRYESYTPPPKNNNRRSSDFPYIIIFLILGVIVMLGVLIGVGWWYYNSNKSKFVSNEIVLDDSIAQINTVAVDTVAVVTEMVEVDTVAVEDGSHYMSEADEKEDDDNSYDDETVSSSKYEESAPQEKDDNKVFDMVEIMPSFPSGSASLMQWLSQNIQYPVVAEDNGIQGRVVVTFVVEKDGSITDVRIAKSVDPSLDKEALRVVRSMPSWKPGLLNGKPVRVKYTIPVTFKLQ